MLPALSGHDSVWCLSCAVRGLTGHNRSVKVLGFPSSLPRCLLENCLTECVRQHLSLTTNSLNPGPLCQVPAKRSRILSKEGCCLRSQGAQLRKEGRCKSRVHVGKPQEMMRRWHVAKGCKLASRRHLCRGKRDTGSRRAYPLTLSKMSWIWGIVHLSLPF